MWQALTDINLLKQWLPFFADFKPEVGFETRFKLGPSEDRQYEHICQITEVIDGKKLTYSWRYEGFSGDSYITFDLHPEQDKTKVTLTYNVTEPFPVDNPDFAPEMSAKGFTFTADALKDFSEKN